jgi:hypothetical protein
VTSSLSLETIGEVSEEHNGKVSVGGETETLHRPSGKDIGEQVVVDLGRMLSTAASPPRRCASG